MTNSSEGLVLEHLRAIREDVGDVRERLTQVKQNTATLGQQLGALITAVYGAKSETQDLRRRIERIEQRLDLTDA